MPESILVWSSDQTTEPDTCPECVTGIVVHRCPYDECTACLWSERNCCCSDCHYGTDEKF